MYLYMKFVDYVSSENIRCCTITAKYCIFVTDDDPFERHINNVSCQRVTRWHPLGSFVAHSSSTPLIKLDTVYIHKIRLEVHF